MKTCSRKTFKVRSLCSLGVLMVAAIIGCSTEGKPSSKTADTGKQKHAASVKVVIAEVKTREFEDWGSYSADLRGVEDAVLTAPYQGGRVTMVKAVGSFVKAGQALCGIDKDKYEAAYEAAKAQVEMTKGDLERATANVEKGAMGRSVVDGANLGFQNARMMLASAKRAYEDCLCQAPFDGVLVSKSIEKFQTINPGMPTVRLSRIDRLEAVIAIPETEAFSFKEGMKTEFSLLQRPETVFEGKISSIDRVVDSRSRTVSARIVLANKNNILKPGMVGRANILRKTFKDAIVIPSTALVRLQNEITVMIAEQGLARQHSVKIGASVGDSTMITEGLEAGDKLIVTGAFQVSEGTGITW